VTGPTILVVFPYEDEYGPFRTLRFVLKGFAAGGYHAICVLPAGAPVAGRLADLGVEIRSVSGLATFPRTLNPARLSSFLTQHVAVANEIQQIAVNEDAQMIYTLSEAVFCGSLAAKRLSLPSIVHVIGLSIGSPKWTANLYIHGLERLTTRFVACSAAVAEMLERFGIPEERISVVHSGVAVDEIDRTADAPSPIDFAGPKLGMVAAYDPRKGHQLFVEAAAQLILTHEDARFYIIGGVLQGQRESIAFDRRVRELIELRGLTNHFVHVGHVPADEVYPWIRALDVFILPSRTEAFGYVQFEAMACYRPVIATRIEGNLDAFIDGDSGLYVDQSPDDVARAASRLIDDAGFAARIGRAARERVVRFFDEKRVLPTLVYTLDATLGRDRTVRRVA
jgi:glycosyltransferase involved in cell wall biosynthesis